MARRTIPFDQDHPQCVTVNTKRSITALQLRIKNNDFHDSESLQRAQGTITNLTEQLARLGEPTGAAA